MLPIASRSRLATAAWFAGAIVGAVACGPEPLPACQTAPADLFPLPRVVRQSSSGLVPSRVCLDTRQHPALQGELATRLGDAGLAVVTSDCHWWIELSSAEPTPQTGDSAIWVAGAQREERHAAVTTVRDGRVRTIVHQANVDAAFWAVRDLLALRDNSNGCVAEGAVIDYPSFAVRGIVESFDGAIYSSADRRMLIDLAGRLRLNRWLYGPKADHYTHEKWADLYPAPEAQAINDAATAAAREHIRFGWAISPGISNWDEPPAYSIKYSSDVDFDKLTSKIESVRALGVSDFALFLDDIHEQLAWPEDLAAFNDLTEAHIFLANRLSRYLRTKDPRARLVFVGTWYTNAFVGWEDYVSRLGASLDQEVDFFWTGPTVVSTTISKSEMAEVNQRFGRPVLIWDNFPGSPESYSGRDPALHEVVAGLYSNPVVNEAGHFPTNDYANVLGTIGDYLWNSQTYDPVTSWSRWQLALQK